MKKKLSVGSILVYLFLSIWAFTTIYPIIWVIQNSFKAKDKILADSFSLPVGDLFTIPEHLGLSLSDHLHPEYKILAFSLCRWGICYTM